MNTGDVIRCPNCKSALPYHTTGCIGWPAPVQNPQPRPLTEDDVRRIVRDEQQRGQLSSAEIASGEVP